MKFFGIYKTTNKVNGKMYIGLHITDDLDDGYMGSGIWINHAIKKYGEEAFTKEWLEFAENAEDLNYLERMYVNEEWLARPDTYNLALGGISHREFSKTTKELISENTKKAMVDPEVKARCSKAKKGKTPWNKGKQGYLTAEGRQKIAAANKSRIGKVYWNNGKDRVLAAECPGEGWARGRTISKE